MGPPRGRASPPRSPRPLAPRVSLHSDVVDQRVPRVARISGLQRAAFYTHPLILHTSAYFTRGSTVHEDPLILHGDTLRPATPRSAPSTDRSGPSRGAPSRLGREWYRAAAAPPRCAEWSAAAARAAALTAMHARPRGACLDTLTHARKHTHTHTHTHTAHRPPSPAGRRRASRGRPPRPAAP